MADNFEKVFVSRSDIARLAGVRRPAVTNWQRRHPDFPVSVTRDTQSAEPEMFRADEVLEWLSRRSIPANALQPGEPSGTTYGDRFRSALTGERPGKLLTAVEQLARREADRFRGRLRLPDYLTLLLFLVFVRATDPERWSSYLDLPESVLADFVREEHLGHQDVREEFTRAEMADVLQVLDRNTPASPHESQKAFDRLLTLLRDTEARAGAEFLTPSSVSRVMAGSLASHGSPARTLHDPFCRTGELLSAYLDTVAGLGGPVPEQVSGRGPQEGELRLAWMNVRLHGAVVAELTAGPRAPVEGPADPPRTFDAVITNPPFGGRLPKGLPPQEYWWYAPSRTIEFDWLQYAVSRLAPGGRAAVLMPAGAAFRTGADQEIRARMVEDGVVECVMALPPQLFELTAVQTHVWLLRSPRGRGESVLFVRGEHLGHMASRTRRVLSDGDVDTLVREYRAWREAMDRGRDHAGAPGLSRVVEPEEIAAHDHRLDPAQYVRDDRSTVGVTDPAAVKDRLAQLSEEIGRLHARARAADLAVEDRLRRFGL
ncbi:N-6 DNA methylase [Streptomyces himalayensis]|uniref:site-specific DNA-methyltransferase (adenine-specific) n=1 Tax=Streptomyces himalayensis subsp. himalayensis TaxID=2756131 RepID=A0A7W0DMX3_9ACTN|nr:N-6 DNA methylase [Streptomyces himalayensis]MBA2947289.1 N-6 DNA methylase [Streptomyces himalayensis subsp. himalayensis]